MGATGFLVISTKGCNASGALYIHASETGNRVGVKLKLLLMVF